MFTEKRNRHLRLLPVYFGEKELVVWIQVQVELQ